jgi:hypothetical protein
VKVPVEELKYAKNIVMPIVEAVYARFEGQPVNLPAAITHLSDIHADTGPFAALMNTGDERTKILLRAMFADGKLFGAIDRDDANRIGIIAFRGTKKLFEWIEDFFFPIVPFDEVQGLPAVHLGFHLVYTLARKELLARLSLLTGVDRIIVTGHSLGAAVATLCAHDLAEQGLPKVEGCTFASPRAYFASTDSFQKAVPKNLRVANPVDIVTHVPSLLQGFVHVQGGFDIDPKIADFHSLELTYGPGLQKKIDGSTAPLAQASDAERAMIFTEVSSVVAGPVKTVSEPLLVEYNNRGAQVRVQIPTR